VHFDAFKLLCFPDALLLGLVGLAAGLLLLVALLVCGALLLVPASGFLADALLLEVVFLALLALHEGFLGLLEPQDILDELLLDLVGNHQLVVVLFGLVLLGLEVGDLVSDLGALVVNLLQLRCVALLRVVDVLVLLLHFLDFAVDCPEQLLDLGQVLGVLLLF
jgi:hypothetical protein